MKTDRLDQLLDAYFDQALNDKDREELEYLLLTSPQARLHFWRRARFHALLRRFGTENWGKWLAEHTAFARNQPPLRSTSWRGKWADVLSSDWLRPVLRWSPAALALVLVLLAIFWRPIIRPVPPVSEDLTQATNIFPHAVAELVHAVNVEWNDPAMPLKSGAVLEPGWVKFKRGLVELQFYRGARIVVEGPAEFQLISDMEATCRLGKLRVDVPPSAHGFKLQAPHAQVVDLGTAFGMEVSADGQTEVHVLEGKVEMASASGGKMAREFTQGQSVHVNNAGEIRDIRSNPGSFPTSAQVEQRALEEKRRKFAAWQRYSRKLAEDPSLLLYYNFEDTSDQSLTLPNLAKSSQAASAGTIIGGQWAEGRWPGKRALDFKQFGDRIRFSLSSNPTALTCMAWVRVDSVSHAFNALMMSGDGVEGEIQWQLNAAGKMLFGKRTLPGWGSSHMDTYYSEWRAVKPTDMGLWVQLAFVYDSEAGTVTHYANGRALGRTCKLTSSQPIKIGSMEIGNWTPRLGDPMEPGRNLNGRIDEFAVFGRALSADEISRAYKAGRPF